MRQNYHHGTTDWASFFEARRLYAGQPPFFCLPDDDEIMHLLYLDESGSPEDPADKHFILAGLSAFEKNTHFLSTETDGIQAKHFPGSPPIDFHAQHIRSGKGFWRNQDKTIRDAVLDDIASLIAQSYPSVRLFLVRLSRRPLIAMAKTRLTRIIHQ